MREDLELRVMNWGIVYFFGYKVFFNSFFQFYFFGKCWKIVCMYMGEEIFYDVMILDRIQLSWCFVVVFLLGYFIIYDFFGGKREIWLGGLSVEMDEN